MDKQTFLTSGLLEQYVLGITDPEETQEVERYLNLYPELNQEVTAMRDAIKQYALQQDIPAPAQRTSEPERATNAPTTKTYGQIHWLSTVVLTETAANTEAAALVYWNKESKKAMLNPFNLPKLPQDKQYQIWVDVAGKMISIGLISTNLEKYQDLKYLDEATSLNITIEPLGGSSEPTVSRLVANHAI